MRISVNNIVCKFIFFFRNAIPENCFSVFRRRVLTKRSKISLRSRPFAFHFPSWIHFYCYQKNYIYTYNTYIHWYYLMYRARYNALLRARSPLSQRSPTTRICFYETRVLWSYKTKKYIINIWNRGNSKEYVRLI